MKLCDCKKEAIWVYMPGFSNKDNNYFCDDCVPRGCSCEWNHTESDEPEGIENINWKYVDPKFAKEGGMINVQPKEYWVSLDEKKREYPCCEYYYSEEGFDDLD